MFATTIHELGEARLTENGFYDSTTDMTYDELRLPKTDGGPERFVHQRDCRLERRMV